MMQSSSDTTASTSPISPFSSLSVPSEPTSDELPDLGSFTTVLRAWSQLHPHPRTYTHHPQHSTSASSSSMEPESDDFREPALAGSTVWSQRPIASYLNSTSVTTDTDGRSPSTGSGSNTEGDARTLELLELDAVEYELSDLEDLDLEQPSLGLLEEALSFLVAERARWNAQREAGAAANEGAWKHVVEPRRKRRRKRRNPKTDDTLRDDPIEEADSITAEDADDSSSSFDNTTTTTTTTTTHKSVPTTPARSRKDRRQQQALATTSAGANRVLIHSKSTPQLRVLPLSHELHPHYPRVVQLRTLAKKLGKLFPPDKPVMDRLIPDDLEFHRRLREDDYFVDPRGPPPGDTDTLIHVFIDHSNILIGLLSYLKRNPRIFNSAPSAVAGAGASSMVHVATPAPTTTAFSFSKPTSRSRHLSHAALALILERGRPITRRVLVASSPLYQPMDSAERLGYEVRVYARVPDLGDGADRSAAGGGRPGQGHHRSLSAGTGGLMGFGLSSGGFTGGAGAGGGGGVAGEFPAALRNPRLGANGNGIGNGNSGGEVSGGGGGRRGRKGHVRRTSGSTGSTSTESEHGQMGMAIAGAGFPQAFIRSLGVNGAAVGLSTSPGSPPIASSMHMHMAGRGANGHSPSATVPPKVRYREQGVDELLQLKLHQALAALDGPPPPGATIVLATGDGNVGQFNEDGFLGPVRTALKKGWRVELYAWEEGLSRSWMREFGEWTQPTEGEQTGRFRVVGLEQFAGELLEIY
ncbi:hypothetical protein GGX14DRAFT_654704 [Mycena pura]|uniref:NYN domain-containing protein n=1 Tax=Mycena pura TaxID=153505 RepID=A0AAD6V7V6_9AGAR|nr:hypothetical protein GGX14DRAFT_654704 [Mycena pura]